MLVIDTATFERALFNSGFRGPMLDSKTGQPRAQGSTLSLDNLLRSLNTDIPCARHNAGNDAFLSLVALQLLLEPENTKLPTVKQRIGRPGTLTSRQNSAGAVSAVSGVPMMAPLPLCSPPLTFPLPGYAQIPPAGANFDTTGEFGQMPRSPAAQRLPHNTSVPVRLSKSVGLEGKGGKPNTEIPVVASYGSYLR